MSGTFAGFPAGTVKFLKGLRADNTKAWFDDHRADYDTYFVGAGRDFVAALGPRLQEIAPDVRFEPKINGSLFRINRDVRFSKDKTPYKDHLDLWFWHGERKGWGAPGFWFRLSPDVTIMGAGMHRFEKEHATRYRNAVLDDTSGPDLESAIADVTAAGPYTLGGATRKTVPRGFDKAHPRAGWLLHDGLTVSVEGKPVLARRDDFLDVCASHYANMAPLVRWLLTHVSDGTT